MKRLLALSLCLMMVLLAVAGCTPKSDDNGDKTGGLESISYSMATGPADGGATIQGTAWADVVKRLAGLNVKVVTSGGYLANVAFVENGDADLGIASAGLLRAALNGEADFVNYKKCENLRAICPIVPGVSQFFTARDDIKTMADLNGRSINVVTAATIPGWWNPRILEALGIEYQRVETGYGSANEMIQDGTLDVNAIFGGVPHTQLMQIEAVMDVHLIEYTDEQIAKLTQVYPDLIKTTIPGGSYKGTPEDITTVMEYQVLVGRKDLDEDWVYEFVKATFENIEEMGKAYDAHKDLDPATVIYVGGPLHVGALKYFQEIGIEIPSELIPPEANS